MNRAKYYVAVRPQTSGHHAVHKEGCPFITENEKRIYLGKFGAGGDAINESRKYFKKTECCPFCSKESKIFNDDYVLINITDEDMVKGKLHVPAAFHQSLFCCIN